MFCNNCGTENDKKASFCKKCGYALKDDDKTGDENQKNLTDDTKTVDEPVEGKSRVSKKVLVLAIVLTIILFFTIGAVINLGKTIDLNQYVTIKASGFEGYGTTQVSIDWNAIEEKYGEKLSFKTAAKKEYGEILYYMEPIELLRSFMNVRVDKTQNIKNGDVITYYFVVDEEFDEYVKCKIKHKEDTYKVSGLKEITTFDAFADLKVNFSGIAPSGRMSYEYTGNNMKHNDFICDNTSHLKNGDKVIIKIDENKLEYYAGTFGMIPAEFEKTYTVEELDSYILSTDSIDTNTMNSMQKQAEEVFSKQLDMWDSRHVTLEDFSYIGNYLFTDKEMNSNINNILYLVYKVQSHNMYTRGKQSYDEMIDSYWYISFSNVLIDSDGNVDADITKYHTPSNTFKVDTGISTGWIATKCWWYYGYPTLEELNDALILKHSELYNYEDNIN